MKSEADTKCAVVYFATVISYMRCKHNVFLPLDIKELFLYRIFLWQMDAA
jgi:hypothetical protein